MDILKRSTPWPPLDRVPVFRPGHETATGGFSLSVVNLAVGTIIPAGTALSFDEITRVAKVIKTAVVYANVANNAVVIEVSKGHLFVVGEVIAHGLAGAAYTISGIDTSNALYDSITIDTTLGVAITAGDSIFQAAAETANASAEFAPISGLLKSDVLVSSGNNLVDAVIACTVYARRIPALINGLKAKLPTIIFSNSK